MKALYGSLILTLAIVAPVSARQAGNSGPTRGGGSPSFTPTPGSNNGGSALSKSMGSIPGSKKDDGVVQSQNVPEPIPMSEMKAPTIALPESIDEALLLQKENGPFMVNAYSFVGPDAAKYAQLLVMELRQEYKLPAYIWYARIDPGRSMIQKVQPTAPTHVRNGDLARPESDRLKDEAIVLVGNCKSFTEATELLKQVKPIKPVSITKLPTIYVHRQTKGLFRATVTVNPFQATQNLYPGRGPVAGLPQKNGEKLDLNVATTKFEQVRVSDPLVKRMNRGNYSLFKNPSEYTLKVREFGGRSAVEFSTQKGTNNIVDRKVLEKSPLMTAHEDAELLAEALSKCKTMQGYRAYVYHTRATSYVTIGGFGSEKDASAQALKDLLPKITNELIQRNLSQLVLLPSDRLMAVPKEK